MNILHITHRGGGGTEFFLQQLIKNSNKFANPHILRPVSKDLLKIEYLVDGHIKTEEFFLNSSALFFIIKKFKISHIHIHNLLGYDKNIINLLIDVKTQYPKIYTVFTIHDYYCFCPAANMRRTKNNCCINPTKAECMSCTAYKSWDLHYMTQTGKENMELFTSLFASMDKITAPSNDTAERVNIFFPKAKIERIPHDESYFLTNKTFIPQVRNINKIKTIVILGELTQNKGFSIIKALAQISVDKLKICCLGAIEESEPMPSNVWTTGRYQGDIEALSLISILNPDLIYMPAIGPETYSYALSLGFMSGLPIYVNNVGALAERVSILRGQQFIIPREIYSNPDQLLNFMLNCNNQTKYSYTPNITPAITYYC